MPEEEPPAEQGTTCEFFTPAEKPEPMNGGHCALEGKAHDVIKGVTEMLCAATCDHTKECLLRQPTSANSAHTI